MRFIAVSILIAATATAGAQPSDNKTLAEQLYNEARDLAKADNWAAACPKFEASLHYDAAIGTRLNLANCYEKLGRIASAWGLYKEAAEAAARVGDTTRHDYAVTQASALEPRLPKLTVNVAKAPPGLQVTRDDTPIEATALGSSLYVDPGEHVVKASASGFETYTTKVQVTEGKAESITIPALVARPEPPPQDHVVQPGPDPGKRRKLIALGAAAGGVVSAGIGLVFGIQARGAFADAKKLCGVALACDSDADYSRGKQLISDANSQATLSTVFVAIGGAAIVTGAVLYLTAPDQESTQTAIAPVITHDSLGLVLGGRF